MHFFIFLDDLFTTALVRDRIARGEQFFTLRSKNLRQRICVSGFCRIEHRGCCLAWRFERSLRWLLRRGVLGCERGERSDKDHQREQCHESHSHEVSTYNVIHFILHSVAALTPSAAATESATAAAESPATESAATMEARSPTCAVHSCSAALTESTECVAASAE